MSRLRLRPFTPADVAVLNVWVTDDALLRLFAGPGLRLPLTFDALVAPADDTCLAFAVTDTADGRTIGHAQLRRIDPTLRSCRIARVLLDPSVRGGGLGSELVRALVDHARHTLRLDEIVLNVYPENTAAVRCYERCGFVFTGRQASVADAGVEMRYEQPA